MAMKLYASFLVGESHANHPLLMDPHDFVLKTTVTWGTAILGSLQVKLIRLYRTLYQYRLLYNETEIKLTKIWLEPACTSGARFRPEKQMEIT